MAKVHGLIAINTIDGRLVKNSYGDVLLFKSTEDAKKVLPLDLCFYTFHKVLTAYIPRTKKGQSK